MDPITIKSGKSSHARFRTFMCYGDPRTGKTQFSGTFPNTVFISDATERGWTTLEEMDPNWLYHEDKGPVILPVHDQQTMTAAIAIAEEWVRKGWIDTIVMDSITFYAESWFQTEHRKMAASAGPKGVDTRGLYGAMANHLSYVQQQLHKLACNVVWLALAAAADENMPGGPMLSGKSRARFPARCDYIFYHRRYEGLNPARTEETPDEPETVLVYEAQTSGFEKYMGGGRDGGKLPAALQYPSFRVIAEILSLPEYEPKHVPEAAKTAAAETLKIAAAPKVSTAAKPADKPAPTKPKK
jgi:hypothetical protein